MKSSKTSFLRNCISGWNVREKNKSKVVSFHVLYLSCFRSMHKGKTIPLGGKYLTVVVFPRFWWALLA